METYGPHDRPAGCARVDCSSEHPPGHEGRPGRAVDDVYRLIFNGELDGLPDREGRRHWPPNTGAQRVIAVATPLLRGRAVRLVLCQTSACFDLVPRSASLYTVQTGPGSGGSAI